jgi:hypothetical protein
MKKIYILFFMIAVITATQSSASMHEAKMKAKKMQKRMKRAGFTMMNGKGARLNNSKYKTFKLFLYKGNNYALMAYGDKSVKDLDVIVYNRQWEVVGEDYKSVGPKYKLYIKAKETGVYYVTTTMYEGSGYFFQLTGWK